MAAPVHGPLAASSFADPRRCARTRLVVSGPASSCAGLHRCRLPSRSCRAVPGSSCAVRTGSVPRGTLRRKAGRPDCGGVGIVVMQQRPSSAARASRRPSCATCSTWNRHLGRAAPRTAGATRACGPASAAAPGARCGARGGGHPGGGRASGAIRAHPWGGMGHGPGARGRAARPGSCGRSCAGARVGVAFHVDHGPTSPNGRRPPCGLPPQGVVQCALTNSALHGVALGRGGAPCPAGRRRSSRLAAGPDSCLPLCGADAGPGPGSAGGAHAGPRSCRTALCPYRVGLRPPVPRTCFTWIGAATTGYPGPSRRRRDPSPRGPTGSVARYCAPDGGPAPSRAPEARPAAVE